MKNTPKEAEHVFGQTHPPPLLSSCSCSSSGDPYKTTKRVALLMWARSVDGRHDLDVLQGAVGGIILGVPTADARPVADGGGRGGQLHQALVLTVHRQLVDVEVGALEALLGGQLRQHLGVVRVGDAQRTPAQQGQLLGRGSPQILQTYAGLRGPCDFSAP